MTQLSSGYAYQVGPRVSKALLVELQGYFRMRIEEIVRYPTDNAPEFLGLEAPFTEVLLERFYRKGCDLLEDYPERPYAGVLPWDVTAAECWNLFATDPEMNNVGRDPLKYGWRAVAYCLNAEELAIFKKQGFVGSGWLGKRSFGDAFYDLWTDDLPVYISSDAALQAWPYSFQSSLEEIDSHCHGHRVGEIGRGV